MKSSQRVVYMTPFLLTTGATLALASTDISGVLQKRYPESRIEVQNAAVQGTVASLGARLRLETDGVPAKPFRVTQANTKSPRFHAQDYARVEVASGQIVTLEPGDLKLSKGTELVVLDLKVQVDTVRLFTHTTVPISGAGGRRAYGCTEFVFRFNGRPLTSADTAHVQQAIEQWLSLTA